MGAFSWWHIVIVALVFIMFFGGKGKVSDVMGDVAKGIKSFKKGLADDPVEDVKSLEANATEAARKAADKVQG